MNDYLVTYIILRLDYIQNLTECLGIVSCIIGAMLFFVRYIAMMYEEEADKAKCLAWAKKFTLIAAILAVLYTLLPSTKDAALIYMLPKLKPAQGQALELKKQAINSPINLMKLANVKMDEVIRGKDNE